MSSLTLTHTHYFSKNQTKERGETNWKYKKFPPKIRITTRKNEIKKLPVVMIELKLIHAK
jgi:hypothetical protein